MLGEQSISLPQPPARTSPLVRYQKVLILAGLLILAVGYLIATSIQNTAVYYLTITELRARSLTPGEIVRVNGWVQTGTIEKAPDGTSVRFVMYDKADPSQTLVVSYRGLIPDTFVDGAEVVVEGKLLANGQFEATTLLAKCPSKFEAAA
jgi:cytochrome c-type biogenesis protein CcmE